MSQQDGNPAENADSGSQLEHKAIVGIGCIGIVCNCMLAVAVICQRHTRRTSTAFILHSCALNSVLAGLSIILAQGLIPNALSVSSCNRIGTLYVLLMTASVFNLVAVTCSEVYVFDNCSQALKKTPSGSLCCVLFAILLVYTGSIILHLGPTLIGANFERTTNGRCLLVYGQTKNYIVYTMWILIVSIALAAACYYLVIFYRVIDKTIEAKLVIIANRQDEISVELSAVEKQLDKLAEVKHNRQRVLAVSCGLHIASWYPLFFLLLADPSFKVSPDIYRALTLLGFFRCALEPIALLLFDTSINHWLLKRLPCGRNSVTESQVNRWLNGLQPSDSLRNHPHDCQSTEEQEDEEEEEEEEERDENASADQDVSCSVDYRTNQHHHQQREYHYHSPFSSVQQQRRQAAVAGGSGGRRSHSPITLV